MIIELVRFTFIEYVAQYFSLSVVCDSEIRGVVQHGDVFQLVRHDVTGGCCCNGAVALKGIGQRFRRCSGCWSARVCWCILTAQHHQQMSAYDRDLRAQERRDNRHKLRLRRRRRRRARARAACEETGQKSKKGSRHGATGGRWIRVNKNRKGPQKLSSARRTISSV